MHMIRERTEPQKTLSSKLVCIIHALDPCGSAFQGAEVVWCINGNSDERIIVLIVEQASNNFIRTDIHKTYPFIGFCIQQFKCYILPLKDIKLSSYHNLIKSLPRLNAAQTPDCTRAKTISWAETISITFDRFFRKGSTIEECPFGSWVSYSSWWISIYTII